MKLNEFLCETCKHLKHDGKNCSCDESRDEFWQDHPGYIFNIASHNKFTICEKYEKGEKTNEESFQGN